MSHISQVLKGVKMNFKTNRLFNAKDIANALQNKQRPKIPILDRFYYWKAKYLSCGCIKTFFRVNIKNKIMVFLFKIYLYATTSGTFPNYVATTILGFLGGLTISYLYFTFCALALNLSTTAAFYVSTLLMAFLTIGMAFFQAVRCVVLSVIPEVCTSRARAMLISFALLLLLTGPGSNMLFNCRQLTDTVLCTHEQLRAVNHNLTELYKKPLRALRAGIMHVVKSIKPFIDKLKGSFEFIIDAITTIVKTIRLAFMWLRLATVSCNNKTGTPHEQCLRMFIEMRKACEVEATGLMRYICKATDFFSRMCEGLKALNLICTLKTFIKETVFDFLKTKLKDLGLSIKTMFYVSLKFHHSFDFETNQSKTIKQVLTDVYHSQQNRLSFFLHVFGFMRFLIGLYIIYVLFSAFIYRFRFFVQPRFDNRHINKYLIELDTKRASINRQTLFPLTRGEKSQYVSLFSLRLTSAERKIFARDSVFLICSCIKMFFMFILDVILSWILSIMHNHGRIAFYFGNDRNTVQAQGSGLWWKIYTFINRLLEPFDVEFRFDTKPCLPTPIPLDLFLYERILIFCWILVLFQPFGLRFRNHVLCNYYPEPARRRAIWLYNHILQTRGTFSLYVKRQYLTQNRLGLRVERIDFQKWIIARFPKMKWVLPYQNLYKECLVCGYDKPKVRCVTPDCPGWYCKDCFKIINYVCISCNMPQNFTGLEVSEEEDSDGDEADLGQPKKTLVQYLIQLFKVDSGGKAVDQVEEALIYGVPAELVKAEKETKLARNDQPKDYFDEKWRRDDWACIEDFSVPMPDFYKWARPQYKPLNLSQDENEKTIQTTSK